MHLQELFNIAFADGCGVQLDLKGSPFQSKFAAKRELYEHGQSFATSIGRWQWEVAAAFYRGESTCPNSIIATNREITQLTLLEHLGQELVTQAAGVLPADIANEAVSWSRLSQSKQTALVQRLYDWITDQFYDPATILPCNVEELLEKVKSPYNYHQLFPRFWEDNGCKPNCLGVALILIAFASLTGAHFRLLNVINSNVNRVIGLTGQLFDLQAQDYKVRPHLQHMFDKNDWEKLEAPVRTGQLCALGYVNFHHCIALQRSNKRWLVIDPFLKTTGNLPREWPMDSIDELLSTHQMQLPGLALLGHYDAGFCRLESQSLVAMRRAIKRSRKVEENLGDNLPEDFAEVQRLLPYPMRDQAKQEELYNAGDEVMRGCCISRLLAGVHASVISDYYKQRNRVVRRDLHPAMEVCANPYLHLGVFVLNGVREGIARTTPLDSILLCLTGSQCSWRETQRYGTVPGRLASLADQVIGRLPARHPLVESTYRCGRRV